MYYRGAHAGADGASTHPEVACYAESADGIHWTRPELGLHEFAGSRKNNIVLVGAGAHNFAPFRDDNPQCPPAARYKAVGADGKSLLAFQSPDGVHWERLQAEPIIVDGAFDSLNLVFWDAPRGEYRAYYRDFRDGVRDIKTAVSKDFVTWTPGEWLDYGGAPAEHLYTNAIVPYERSSRLYVGLPMRFLPDRNPEGHEFPGVSDCVLMTSRDGLHFHRWGEALIRPGLQPDRWVNRNNLAAWGIVETASNEPGAPAELSIYATEGYYRGAATRLRRYTLRRDGFVSVRAGAAGGELVTRPLVLPSSGDAAALWLNFATSAAGSIRCEVQNAAGEPLPGLALDDCRELYGDSLEKRVEWAGGASLATAAAGQPVRLRFVLRDADLFALRVE
jgi:hypothetical protein